MTAAEVDADLTDDPLLGIGEWEGKVLFIEGVELVAYLAKYIALVETLAAFFCP